MTAKRKPRRSHDWEAIRIAYVEGFPTGERWRTQAATAEAFGVRRDTLNRHHQAGDWEKQRAAAIASYQVEQRKARARALADQSADFADRALNLANGGFTAVSRRLAYLLNKADEESGDGWETSGHDPGADVLDGIELQRLARAGRAFQQMGLSALGESTDDGDVDDMGKVLRTEAERRMLAAIRSLRAGD